MRRGGASRATRGGFHVMASSSSAMACQPTTADGVLVVTPISDWIWDAIALGTVTTAFRFLFAACELRGTMQEWFLDFRVAMDSL